MVILRSDGGNDDAFISYRFAYNLATGNGIVYNPGEYVEGYSNFLYVILMSFFLLIFKPEHIYFVSVAINLIFGSAVIILVHSFTKKAFGQIFAFLPALLTSICLPMAIWTVSGLETIVVVLVQLAIVFLVDLVAENPCNNRNLFWLMIAMAISILLRADGFLIPFLAIAYLVINRRFEPAVIVFVWIAMVVAVYFSWRYYYYGYFLPNTFYNKVDGNLLERFVSGTDRIKLLFFWKGLCIPIMFLAADSFLCFRWALTRRSIGPISFEVVFFWAWLSYYIWIGGDVYNERFLLTLYPLGFYALAKCLYQFVFGNTKNERARYALQAISFAFVIFSSWFFMTFKFSDIDDWWYRVAQHVNENYHGQSMAVVAAGKVPFFNPDSEVIDMLGLTDEHIAHQSVKDGTFVVGHSKYDNDYVLSRRPKIIISWMDEAQNLSTTKMPREKWQEAGYKLCYLVKIDEPIMPVEGISDERFSRMWQERYRYGILVLSE